MKLHLPRLSAGPNSGKVRSVNSDAGRIRNAPPAPGMLRAANRRATRLVRLVGLASLILSACASNGNAGQVNQTAERILTAAAERPTATLTTTVPSATTPLPTLAEPTATPQPTATLQPPMVFARCIIRAELSMRTQPGESAQAAAPLRPSDIVTAYGRTADSRWILAWNREITFGWIPSSALGCTAPFEDLRPTDPDILLTPQPTAERAMPTTPIAGTATATAVSVAAITTATVSATVTETPAPTAMATATATETPALTVTATATATETPAPTATAMATATEVPPTATATPVMQPTATITATAEPVPPAATPTTAMQETPVPSEALACVVASTMNLNLRSGPARTARLIGKLRPGAKFSATGRNAEGTWLYGATERGAFGWVIASAMRCEGDVRALPIVADGG